MQGRTASSSYSMYVYAIRAYRLETSDDMRNSLSAFAKPSHFLLLNAILRLTFSSQLTPPLSDRSSNAPWFFNRFRRYISSVLTYLLTLSRATATGRATAFSHEIITFNLAAFKWLDILRLCEHTTSRNLSLENYGWTPPSVHHSLVRW